MPKIVVKEPPAPGLLGAAGLWLGAVAVPLIVSSSVSASFTLPKLAALSLGALASAAAFFAAAVFNGYRPAATGLERPLLACAASLALSTSFSSDRVTSVYGNYNYYGFGALAAALYGSVFYLSFWTLSTRARRRQTLVVALGASLAVSLYAALQVLGVEPLPGLSHLVGGRAVATAGSPVNLGAYLALVFPLALHRALVEKDWFGRVCALAVAAGLVASIARASWLSAAAGAAVYCVLSGRLSRPKLSARRIVAAAALALGLAAALASFSSRRDLSRLKEFGRVEIWRTAWRGFLDHPWLGGGPDTVEIPFRRYKTPEYVRSATSTEYQVNAHDDVLQALATTGLLGTAAYLLLWASLGRQAWRRMSAPQDQDREFLAACAAALFALFINMKFNPVPLEAFALAAVLASFLCAPGAPLRAGGAIAGLLLVLAGGALLATLRLARADAAFNEARKALAAGQWDRALVQHEAALRDNPCELVYRISYGNFLNAAVPAATPPVRSELLARVEENGRRAVLCHGNLSNAHYLLGTSMLAQAYAGKTGSLDESERELDAALAEDPLLLSLLESRLQAARLRGDPAKAAEMSARIAALAPR